MPHEGRAWDRVNRTGIGLAASYMALGVAVFVLTLATGSPSDVGLQWIPFGALTMPWSLLFERWINTGVPWITTVALIAFLGGLTLNTLAAYMVGAEAEATWSQFTNWHRDR